MVEVWPGISMATTLSRDPDACGLARFRKDAIKTTTNTAPTAMSTILAGGRFFFAVPYSSPMLIVGPAGAAGVVAGCGVAGEAGGTGVWSGIGVCRASPDFTPAQHWDANRIDRTICVILLPDLELQSLT